MKPIAYSLACMCSLLSIYEGSAQTLSRTEYNSVNVMSSSREQSEPVQNFRKKTDEIILTGNRRNSSLSDPVSTQVPGVEPFASDVSKLGDILSPNAFKRLIKQDMAFTVLGSQIPTPGLSLDLSDKLAAKVTGVLPAQNNPDEKIITLDAEFARAGEEIPLLTNGKFTGKLSGGITGHFFSTKLIKAYPHRVAGEAIVRVLREMENKRFNGPVLDSIAVLAAYSVLTQRELFDNTCRSESDLLTVVRSALNGYEGLTIGAMLSNLRANPKRQLLFLKMAGRYFTLTNASAQTDFDVLVNSLRSLQSTDHWRAEALLKDLRVIATNYTKRNDTLLDTEIGLAKPFIVHKHLFWASVGFRPVLFAYDAFTFRTGDRQATSEKMTFFEFEVPIWLQSYSIHRYGGNLWRFGLQFVYGSNRGSFLNVNYATSRTIASFADEQAKTLNQLLDEKKVSGLWNDGTPQRSNLYANFHAEYYYLPRQNFVPGYSFRVSYGRRGAFGNDALQRLRLEAGLVLNILSSNKTQSAFTIQPFLATTNLLEEVVNDLPVPMRNKLNAGIRLGLPIRGQLQAQ